MNTDWTEATYVCLVIFRKCEYQIIRSFKYLKTY